MEKIKNKLKIKFHITPVYNEKYIKAKAREFKSVIKTNFLRHEIPKQNKHCTFIACINIDSVMRIEKKNYPQVYLEECKYEMKKTKIIKFIEAELKSNLGSEWELEAKSGTELMAKLECKSDSDSE